MTNNSYINEPFDPDLAILLTRFIEECESKYSEMPHDIGVQILSIVRKYLIAKQEETGEIEPSPFEISELNYLLLVLKDTKYEKCCYPDLFESVEEKLNRLHTEAIKQDRIMNADVYKREIQREIEKSHKKE